jgi:hypothetical protein
MVDDRIDFNFHGDSRCNRYCRIYDDQKKDIQATIKKAIKDVYCSCCSKPTYYDLLERSETSYYDLLERTETTYDDNNDDLLERTETTYDDNNDDLLERAKTTYDDNDDDLLERAETTYYDNDDLWRFRVQLHFTDPRQRSRTHRSFECR